MTRNEESGTQRRSLSVRILVWLGVFVVIAAVALGLLHVFIRPVAPQQAPPGGHFTYSCATCHIISTGARIIDVGK